MGGMVASGEASEFSPSHHRDRTPEPSAEKQWRGQSAHKTAALEALWELLLVWSVMHAVLVVYDVMHDRQTDHNTTE